MLAATYVTALLRKWLENDPDQIKPKGDLKLTTLPPDRSASEQDSPLQLSLFLYQVTPNTRLRWPESQKREARPDSREELTLSLDLHYLLTIYGAEDLQTEQLLEYATRRMQRARRLRYVDGRWWADARGNDRAEAIDPPIQPAGMLDTLPNGAVQIAVEPQFLSSEELSKLWSALQARFRLSVAYKVSSMLVDADESRR